MTDFSKKPEGATHYDAQQHETFWYKIKNGKWQFTWGRCSAWYVDESSNHEFLALIPNTLTVTCDNEHDLMLHQQLQRLINNEPSQYCRDDEWVDLTSDSNNPKAVCITEVYRAKPKKELVVPWDILADEVIEVRVDKNGCIYDGGTPLRIKLDLTDIELPVTVKRPEGK